MKKIILLFAISLFVHPLIAQYTATMVYTAGDQQREMKVYSNNEDYRYEFNADGRTGVVISSYKSKHIIILMPEQKMAMKSAAGSPMAMATDPIKAQEYLQSGDNVIVKEKGEETINGIKCKKTEIWEKSSNQSGSGEQKLLTVWQSGKYDLPIKTISHVKGSENSGMEIKDIQDWTPDNTFFEIPEGYQVMDMGGMMPVR